MNQYQKEYASFLDNFLALQKPLKVIFDCSNGTTGEILKHLSANWRAKTLKTILINQNPNGKFPAHGPNPLIKGAMGQIQKEVKKQKADLGVIFDADGDRAFFIDDKGRVIDPDIIASFLIWNLKPQKVVVNETTGSIIRGQNNLSDYRIIKSQNGGYFIKNLMIKNDADFGCERSGHYYFKLSNGENYFYMDSGIISAIKVINAVSQLPYRLSDFADLSPTFFRSKEFNVRINADIDGDLSGLFKKIENKFKDKTAIISHIDGLRMDFNKPDKWWFNIQLSNTEPLIRLNMEALNKQTLAKQAKMLLGLLKNGV